MQLFTTRKGYGLGFLLCLLAMLGAMYFQYAEGLNPCPLCIMQRIAFSAAGIIYLVAFLQNPSSRKSYVIYGILLLVCTLFGLGVAGRQWYLQSLPAGEAPACGPGLDYMLKALPLWDVLKTVLKGTGDCAMVHWRFLTLSIAGWSGLLLLMLNILNLVLLCSPTPKKDSRLKGNEHG